MHTLSDRYGDLDIEELDENRIEDGDGYFGLEPDDEREIDFEKTFQRGEVRSFESDFGYQLDSTLSDLEDENDPEWSDEWIDEFEEHDLLNEIVRDVD